MIAPTFTDRRVAQLVEELVGIQDRISEHVRRVLSGYGALDDHDLLALLERCDASVARLFALQHEVSSPGLENALHRLGRTYTGWSRARVGSKIERRAGDAFIRALAEVEARTSALPERRATWKRRR